MDNNSKFKAWEWLIIIWTLLSGLAFFLEFWDGPLADMIDTPWFRLNQLVAALAFFVVTSLRVRREKQESKQFP